MNPNKRQGHKAKHATALVVKAYLAALLFVALFATVLKGGVVISDSLSQPLWALVVACALTLPALAPWIRTEVVPRIRSIRIAEIEIALEEAEAPMSPITEAARMLSSGLADNPVLSEFAGRMTSLSNSIMDAIKAVQIAGHPVLPVDLDTPWVPPNLYFLALMAAQKTGVQQVAFMDSRVLDNQFVCASSPREIIAAIEARHPELREAARAASIDQDPGSAEQQAGNSFFQSLSTIYSRRAAANTERVVALTAETLTDLLGAAAHRDAVQWEHPPGEAQYRAVLRSRLPYIAALDRNELLFMVSRDAVALAVARSCLR